MKTVQVFVKNQRQWNATPFRDGEVDRFRRAAAKPGFGPIVAHATYLINLATGDDALWSKSITAFTEELRRCDTLGIPYLVVHPGAAVGQSLDVALARVSSALNRIFANESGLECSPLLETTAGQGTTLGRTFEELGTIIDALDDPLRVGVCVDTCHVFAAGYDIRAEAGYEEMMAAADRCVGVERIFAFHLNDSQHDCGSRKDRHAGIGDGFIGNEGFANLLHDARFVGVPMLLETPKGTNDDGMDLDRANIDRLKSIARGG